MTAHPGFFREPETTQCGSPLITHGDAQGRVSLEAAADRLVVVVKGEPSGENLLECFRAGKKQDVVLADMRTLVDLTHFVGVVDWKAVFSLRHLGEGGTGRARRLPVCRNPLRCADQDPERHVLAHPPPRLHRSRRGHPMARHNRTIEGALFRSAIAACIAINKGLYEVHVVLMSLSDEALLSF